MTHNGPRVSMSPERGELRWIDAWTGPIAPPTKCARCGGPVYAGDWPFCKGDPKGHAR